MTTDRLALTTGGDQSKRRALDYYPTPQAVTVALMEFLKLPQSTIWECAAGQGTMSSVLEHYGHRVVSTDIQTGTDYLTTPPPEAFDAIITNPPFNKSQEFIEKALNEADVVAMVLKTQYWHAKKRYQLFIDQPPAFVLPLTWRPDFMNNERGGSPTMDVIWTVWMKGNTSATYRPLQRPAVLAEENR